MQQPARKFTARAIAVLCCALLLCESCQPPPPPQDKFCPPPPEPICKPGSFDATLLDTTEPGPGKLYTHIVELPQQINGNADDNAITFVPDGRGKEVAIVSSDRRLNANEDFHTIQRMYSSPIFSTVLYGVPNHVREEASPLPCGAGVYCAANERFYYSAKAENDDPNDFDLYSATLGWSGDTMHLASVHRVPNVNAEHAFDAQPTLTPDGKVLYFASDRPGGEGGTDIWYSTRTSVDSENWSAPLPLPSPINTPCNELSPCISSDNRSLYFSSDGHATVGGYDIFKCSRFAGARPDEPTAWGEPHNLGKPINTKYDDIFPYAPNDTAFFFTSNEPSHFGGRNIFAITYSRVPLPKTVVSIPTRHLDTTNIHDSIFAALKDVPVTVHGHIEETRHSDSTQLFVSDPETEQPLAEKKLAASGNFELKLNRGKQYDVGVKNEESFYDLKRIDLRNSIDTAMYLTLALPDTLVLRINFPFDDHEHPYQFIIGDSGQQLNITWQHSLDLVAQSIQSSISKLKYVLLLGHTDSLGTDAYNQELGMKRATFVKGELIKRGIPGQLIKIESRGRTMPVVRRPDEEDDIFRLRSRRVEFVKVFVKE